MRTDVVAYNKLPTRWGPINHYGNRLGVLETQVRRLSTSGCGRLCWPFVIPVDHFPYLLPIGHQLALTLESKWLETELLRRPRFVESLASAGLIRIGSEMA